MANFVADRGGANRHGDVATNIRFHHPAIPNLYVHLNPKTKEVFSISNLISAKWEESGDHFDNPLNSDASFQAAKAFILRISNKPTTETWTQENKEEDMASHLRVLEVLLRSLCVVTTK
eukprot:TRINITY_DN7781_c0_g1_i1.p1 TRINITY_DN7781_c0_g1~~TRINITY_DN7781_c0_g1_i1.p1  ORF type:complete len:119 (+),score=22.09 TRINITY_DN7781_c0_g1_i1:518-874(+)